MPQDRFKIISKFLHFADNSQLEHYERNKNIFKIDPVMKHLNDKYKSSYKMGENIYVDESLTLWKGRLAIKTYFPLKAAKFGIKLYKICESFTGYLWQFVIYTASTTEIQTDIVYTDVQKTTQIVIKLMELLFGVGHAMWMDNYYNSPEMCLLLKQKGINVAATLRLNRKEVPVTLRQEKLKEGELVSYHSRGIMIPKWQDKKTSVVHFFFP
jgi:hypothetical protein